MTKANITTTYDGNPDITRYCFPVQGDEIWVFVHTGGGASVVSTNIREQCQYCEEDDCEGNCDDAIKALNDGAGETTGDDPRYIEFGEKRRNDLLYNAAVDGIESLLMEICASGMVADGEGFPNEISIDKLCRCVNTSLEAAGNNL